MYKLKSYKEHTGSVNESIALMLLTPIIVLAAGKLLGYTIGKFAGPQIKKSMDNLVKSRFTEKAKESDIKALYDLIQRDYPDIKNALDKDDDIILTADMKNAGLDKEDEAQINIIIDKLRKYHQSQS